MVTGIFKRHYDESAKNPANLVVDEPHNAAEDGSRIIICNEGIFYTKGHYLRRPLDSAPLVLGVDYRFLGIEPEVVAATGHEAATAIELINPAVYGELLLTCQLVGGYEGTSDELLRNLRDAIRLAADRVVVFSHIRNLPGLYPPGPHTHTIDDVEKLNPLTDAIDKMTQAMVDARPLATSGQALREQDGRTLQLLGRMREDVNLYFYHLQQLISDNENLKVEVSALRETINSHITNHPTTQVTSTTTTEEVHVVEANGSETVTTTTTTEEVHEDGSSTITASSDDGVEVVTEVPADDVTSTDVGTSDGDNASTSDAGDVSTDSVDTSNDATTDSTDGSSDTGGASAEDATATTDATGESADTSVGDASTTTDDVASSDDTVVVDTDVGYGDDTEALLETDDGDGTAVIPVTISASDIIDCRDSDTIPTVVYPPDEIYVGDINAGSV